MCGDRFRESIENVSRRVGGVFPGTKQPLFTLPETVPAPFCKKGPLRPFRGCKTSGVQTSCRAASHVPLETGAVTARARRKHLVQAWHSTAPSECRAMLEATRSGVRTSGARCSSIPTRTSPRRRRKRLQRMKRGYRNGSVRFDRGQELTRECARTMNQHAAVLHGTRTSEAQSHFFNRRIRNGEDDQLRRGGGFFY